MPYYDILFPLNLRPLTYRCPEELRGVIQPGMLVSAQLKKRLAQGIILAENPSPPPGRIRDINAVMHDTPVLSQGMLRLIQWMSDYYIAHEGVVLKLTVPSELFEKTKTRGPKKSRAGLSHPDLPVLSENDLAAVTKSVLSGGYRTFLFFQPSMLHEYALACRAVQQVKNIIIVLPEIAQADMLYSMIRIQTGERSCILHSGVAKGRRSGYIDGIISGKHDIVIGTRMALFSPMLKPSLILVLQEDSTSYKLEEGLMYNIRDVAVMRGYLENAVVALSSITPSVDSYFNVLSKKYTLVTPSEKYRMPAVRVINMRFEKQVRPHITKTLYDKLRQHIEKERRVLFVLNRRGYATLLQCKDCGHIEKCRTCGMPLVFHKNLNALRCHSCGTTSPLPEHCPKCRGHKLEFLGSGTERLQEEIEELLGVKTIRFDSDRAKGRSHVAGLMKDIASGAEKLIIGTKMLSKKLDIADRFPLAAVLNIDNSLGIPDFRASEKAYMEIARIMQLVDPGGEIVIQTRFPELPIFRHIKKNDYLSFAREELQLRKAMNYPPYAKMVKIVVHGCRAEGMLRKTIPLLDSRIEVLGPSEIRDKKGKKALSLMMKANDRKALNNAARTIVNAFENDEDCDVRVDVDPS